ncbi:cytoplasmic protein [Arsenicitalea aurantiaca]|uniref:Cytoplasmic protein n=1 Tax=Arsenicitalea aurantiaca TaxID=1783274 RepID=A0A433XL32_9HYPH|nr:glutamine amidotransferase [Arsenicitalea aurantiaca]RUT34734.1 cytoplasmic protein [Arsenicitalea aurantiaca]
MKILLAGESWISTASHIKGFDQFATATYHTGADRFVAMLEAAGMEVTWIKAHDVPQEFPTTQEALSAFDVVILSDIGANALLLHTDTWLRSIPTPNRLKAIRSYVRAGGGLLMVGGYYSFQGINGGARFRDTPVEDVLPVTILPQDDRLEVPEGFVPNLRAEHDITKGLPLEAEPVLLGLNEIRARPDAQTLLSATIDEGRTHPLLVVGTAGQGRSAAWASDIGPHWMPDRFLNWPGTPELFARLLRWLAQQ